LTRVLIIGDPTRRMGALAEPECRRIVEAIDLASRRRLPIEWVALSAGAAIEFDSGTENLDWTALVLRRIVEFTAAGGVVNVIVDGGCVGAQSYWNAEATMLMHTKGALIMTPRGYMVLTGKKALEYAGSVAGPSNEAIGGLDIMEPNGEVHYSAPDLNRAFDTLFRHYDITYVPPTERYTRRVETTDSETRDVSLSPYTGPGDFQRLGEIVDEATNPGRKKPFAIRQLMNAVADGEFQPLERWSNLADGETAVVQLAQLGGQPVTMIGIESTPIQRKGTRPIDGPEAWMSGTLFPQSSRKVARALRTASGVHPVVVLANLSGFDGSPESLRNRQLEYGAEIGKAVVEFDGPIIFCVVARYHGGAYVVFSQRLNERLTASALAGSYASVIGGAPAAHVVFPRLVRKRTMARDDVKAAVNVLEKATASDAHRARERFEEVFRAAEASVQAEVAKEFDAVHSVERAKSVGSLNSILKPSELRPFLCDSVRVAVDAYLGVTVSDAPAGAASGEPVTTG
ncbi:MAG: carboxyl transferase domain-containing protein, partial [Myxococcota bacterium]